MPLALAPHALTDTTTAEGALALGSGAGGDELTRQINAVSLHLASLCGRSLHYEAAQVDKVKGYGTPYLLVTRPPVVSLASIVDGAGATLDLDGEEIEVEDAEVGSIVRPGGWAWTTHVVADVSGSPAPGTEQASYTVTYAGGYVTKRQVELDEDLTASVPDDLEAVALELLRERWLGRRRDPALKSVRLSKFGASYGSASAEADSWVAQAIARYRRRALG